MRATRRPGVRREVAAIHAAMGHREEAYDGSHGPSMRVGVTKGWSQVRCFTSLREEPRFKTLMQQIDADVGRVKARDP